jgi:carbonic anhydrase
LVKNQQAFAVILGCSDSRVPPEIVFDQGVGDLFVIRVAGSFATPPLIGSIEYAALQFGTRLVLVLGHAQCGAVLATISALQQPAELPSPNLRSIVDHVKPSIEGLLQTEPEHDFDALVQHAVQANIDATVNQLRHDSEVLQRLIRDDGLRVVGAEYSVDTGLVEFFDDMELG